MLGCVSMKMTITKWDESMLTRCFAKLRYTDIQKSNDVITKDIQKVVNKKSEPEPEPEIKIEKKELEPELEIMIDKKEYETTNSQSQQTAAESKVSASEDKIVFKAFLNDSAQKLINEQTKVKTNVMKWDDFEQAMNISLGKADENFDD